MLNSSEKPEIVGDCPRCGEHSMMTPLQINALSRTTRDPNSDPMWVCSDCGTDEGLMDAFLAGATKQHLWPIDERPFQYFIDESRQAVAILQNRAEN